ncbi:MAG: cytosol aminopeptidase [Legionellaceae bacterium]
MSIDCFVRENKDAIPLIFIETQLFPHWLEKQSMAVKQWVKTVNFSAKNGSVCLVPAENNQLLQVLVGCETINNFWVAGNLSKQLPPGNYYWERSITDEQATNIAMSWGLGAYQFNRYKEVPSIKAKLVLPEKKEWIKNYIESIYWIRDLINIPAEELNPGQLAMEAKKLAVNFNAQMTEIIGEELILNNYPAIHAVGRASVNPPRLIDIRWGEHTHPKITLIGKGVCFDTGGLNIKETPYMALMKKDMGGAAHVLGLAYLIMQARLPIQLRVLIPTAENSISGNAYRPGDVIKTRKGLTVEIGNTDAEGRLLLADAMTEACSEKPALIIDFATLTGAARVALGTEIPALFTDNETLAQGLLLAAQKSQDPLWRLPLYKPYRRLLDSQIADINNSSMSNYGGAITAGLFLKEFVEPSIPWVHIDVMAWNTLTQAGRPEGGEAMGIRAVFEYLKTTYV